MTKQGVSSQSSSTNYRGSPHANATMYNAFRRKPFSFGTENNISPVSEFSRERFHDSTPKDKVLYSYNISGGKLCGPCTSNLARNKLLHPHTISDDILWGPRTSNSATEMVNFQFQMNSCQDLTNKDVDLAAETCEDDDISSMGSIYEDEDTMYLCFPAQLQSTQIKSMVKHATFCQKSLGNVKKCRSPLQPLCTNIVCNNSGVFSQFSDFCNTSKFRLSPKLNTRNAAGAIHSPFNPPRLP